MDPFGRVPGALSSIATATSGHDVSWLIQPTKSQWYNVIALQALATIVPKAVGAFVEVDFQDMLPFLHRHTWRSAIL
jgi:hypothetical protein